MQLSVMWMESKEAYEDSSEVEEEAASLRAAEEEE